MSEPSREAMLALADKLESGRGLWSNETARVIEALRAAKPERERVMSKDELETEIRDLAETVKIATIEACAKIAEQCLVGHTLTPSGLARQDEAEDIAARIRALKGDPA